jgi:hypothetical protein
LWFNKVAKKACEKQRRLYNSHKSTGNPILLIRYKTLRRENKKLFRSLKKKYLEKKMFEPFKNGNTKPFFSHIRKLKRDSNSIHALESASGEICTDKVEISNLLNNYFRSVFTNQSIFPDIPSDLANLDLKCTREGIIKLLKSLKTGKAPGPDKLTKDILCLNTEKCAEILVDIFNLSLESGILPDQWKIAQVTPLFKQGNRVKPSNYRPVSLTSICCKVLEHVILHHLLAQLDDVLYPNQHGFRKHYSCSTQLITVIHDILLALDNGQIVHAAVLDFSKAFDVVPHCQLISKMIHYSVDSRIVRWTANFLSNRFQYVKVGDSRSDLIHVTSGVPQGSVLGPVLFLLFINDIVEAVEHCSIRLFADDTLIFLPVESQDDILKFQRDLNNLSGWSMVNNMKFNVSKSNIIVFGKNIAHDPNYTLNNEIIPSVESVKYLGIIINHSLKFDNHIAFQLTKTSRIFVLLKFALHDATPELKKLAYFSLCRPILEYGCEVWDPINKNLIHKLESFQKKVIRFIYGVKGRYTSISELRLKNNISLLQKRRQEIRFNTFLKILEFDNLFPTIKCTLNQMSSNDVTRGSSLLPLTCNTNIYLNSFIPRTAREIRTGDTIVDE